MSLSSILAVPPGPGVLSSLLFVIVFFNLSVVIVMLSCFSVLPFFNYFASSLCVSGCSHILYQNLTWSYVISCILLFQSLKQLRLFWTYCSLLASYLFSWDDVASTLCFSSSITTFSPLSFTLYLFPSWPLVYSVWSPSIYLLYQCKSRDPLHWIYTVFYFFPSSWLLRFC